MQLINGEFTGHLSKFSAKVIEEDVYVEFIITYLSKNNMSEDFLDTFSEEYDNGINKATKFPEWDNIKFSVYCPNLNIHFDVMDIRATLEGIKITQKETSDDHIVKYDLTFIKKQEKDSDTYLATYLKHKDENDEGKRVLSEYTISISND